MTWDPYAKEGPGQGTKEVDIVCAAYLELFLKVSLELGTAHMLSQDT